MTFEPTLHYDVPLSEEDGWTQAGGYLIWHGHLPDAAQPLQLWVRREDKFRELPPRVFGLRVIPAGQPLHVTGWFGFWWVSNRDRMWFQASQPGMRTYVMVAGGMSGIKPRDRLQWYCPQCSELMVDLALPSDYATPAFTAASSEVVAAFNQSGALRTCRQCQTVHPLAYGFGENPPGCEKGW